MSPTIMATGPGTASGMWEVFVLDCADQSLRLMMMPMNKSTRSHA
jgi:hypothetical protein